MGGIRRRFIAVQEINSAVKNWLYLNNMSIIVSK